MHVEQAGKPGTQQYLKTKRIWATELLPLLLAGVSSEKARFLVEFTTPFQRIRDADEAAKNGETTEPVGWEWQAVHMLAIGREGRIDDAYTENRRLSRKIQVNLKNLGDDAKADFFGQQRSLREILRQCRLHRAVVESINGPPLLGAADTESQQPKSTTSDADNPPRHNMQKEVTEKMPDLAEEVAQILHATPVRDSLLLPDEKYLAIFEVDGDELIAKAVREDQQAALLGVACWQRLTKLFPARYRKGLVQFNIQSGRRWAGFFDGSGANDVGRKGYSLSIAKYQAMKDQRLQDASHPLTPRRGTLDWTMVHEMGHYICLTTNAIELFSQAFDGDGHSQPERRKRPDDYPEDGSPVVDGDFVTSYAERTPGDEEVCETFTTYLLVDELPTNDSLVARKIRFFDSLPGYPELREHIQRLGVSSR